MNEPSVPPAQIAIADELFDTHLVTDGVEDTLGRTDRSVFQAKRCGRKTDDPHVGIDLLGIGEELLVHAFTIGRDQMGFVHDDQIEAIELASPPIHRLDAGHDH